MERTGAQRRSEFTMADRVLRWRVDTDSMSAFQRMTLEDLPNALNHNTMNSRQFVSVVHPDTPMLRQITKMESVPLLGEITNKSHSRDGQIRPGLGNEPQDKTIRAAPNES